MAKSYAVCSGAVKNECGTGRKPADTFRRRAVARYPAARRTTIQIAAMPATVARLVRSCGAARWLAGVSADAPM